MAGFPYATPTEYWASPGAAEHKIGCQCGDAGWCELRQLQLQERAERAEDDDPTIPYAKDYSPDDYTYDEGAGW